MADYQYIISSGLIIPATSDILTGVENEYKAAFGADLDVSPSTPQGVLITAETLARTQVVDNNAALANQINPNEAGGIFLDAIGALTGSERVPEEHTLVTCTLTGTPGTIIPINSTASDTVNGFVFKSLGTVTLSGGGTASVVFRAVDPGPFDIAANTLTQILPPGVLGWETITNSDAGTPGTFDESDAVFRTRRKVTLAAQGTALTLAIGSAVNEVEGVRVPAFVYDNPTSAPVVHKGVTIAAHSIYVCASGGSDQDVAEAIFSKKSGGCAYTGNTTVDVLDPYNGLEYPVTFQRPTEVPILIRVTINTVGSLQDPATAVKNAVLNYAAGLVNNQEGFAVGADVSCFELAGAINYEVPQIYVRLVETTNDIITPTYSTNVIAIDANKIATVVESSITVIIV